LISPALQRAVGGSAATPVEQPKQDTGCTRIARCAPIPFRHAAVINQGNACRLPSTSQHRALERQKQ
jgi:hypothetical protein